MNELNNWYTAENITKTNNWEKNLENIDTRIDKLFWNLIGKNFEKWDIIDIIYTWLDGKSFNYKFNTQNNTIILNEQVYNLPELQVVDISKISFWVNEIIIYGKIWRITWKLYIKYKETLKKLDKLHSK